MMEENSSGRPANMMSFMSAMKSGFKNSFSLSGRASRSEYWFWVLGGVIFQMTMVIGSIVLAVMEVPVLPGLMILAPILLVPGSITLVVRRLHDVGMSGWMWFVALVPVIGAIYLIYLFVQEGDFGENAYGAVPTNMLE
ncbi:MAG: DUF805 domain-containing protein [Candidatus Poseidoniales archaeon]|uniref:DUF805 domain-containing protein n=1 Tax=uncultured Poseidoniia archaeon TaxID=1697135 RepID=A0A1B1TEP9_9ARCH|nr:hypothetical protein [uncultured Candidatus Thalassoarchaea sp.]MAS18289.1 DUF805 domain-containing protein [Euryarchaeota archaeon]RCH74764.1 MAG: DUF805 domain-containing protein [Candidatus Poseidoniales archaeon]MAV19578.1 DUF805 domain-containing protein [Euryarchaeota archaeon]MDC0156073.1 DUF805 domain-containing protein [Euryarchaeota archaeon]|tara:strand:- start:1779 stop:2195 length:417 start_codon:yes stop_codon:yes gene_type:complete